MTGRDHSRKGQGASAYRLEKLRRQSLKPGVEGAEGHRGGPCANATVDCGWGRLVFANTFDDTRALTDILLEEKPQRRDIAFYVQEPHVVLSYAPQDLFLDPSNTYRLYPYNYRRTKRRPRGFHIRRLSTREDAVAVNRIYAERNMVEVDPDFYWTEGDARALSHFVAQDNRTGEIVGTVMGVDHGRAYNDPAGGSSLWCLAVDAQSPHAGIGEQLVRQLAEHFQARGCAFMDLSVMHDNAQAIALYEKLGFERLPYFAIKTKNAINEKLFAGPAFGAKLNPYAMILVNEARRRGISVEVLDAEEGYFRLSHGGRSIICRESLSELTTAIAMSRCANKRVTRRLLGQAGLLVPAQVTAGDAEANAEFLARYEAVVVKPLDGEQGQGVAVDIRSAEELEKAVAAARKVDDRVLIEQFMAGFDLRVIVIDFKVVAAAIRRPPQIQGDGQRTVRDLIRRQSRRRAAATGGESKIPLDKETKRCVADAGLDLDDTLPAGQVLTVRRTANLHAGGTIHDVTDQLHPKLVDAAARGARALDIPVVGLDFIVPDPAGPDYIVIEANERPGLANHEPQPTAERFIDLLFPQSIPSGLQPVRKRSIGHGPAQD
ncbi:GNAT family N-acetyltransferase [Rhodothalassium salexigens]|uniref:N-acetylglutaminylglutamine synthetase n=1 Tax=Rhodothalassium salexigens TaxID=1086 RepID=UPI0019142870|nr:N-acetylglutaminylglutamine synthetase [Rhodothalassium salexigens]MBK5912110.1 GNAT family N-acetyltransferase [Rhodothalassium salexigens]